MDTIWQPEIDAGAGPKYRAVAHNIRAAINDDILKAGTRLPPVRELAWTLGITPGTVARAYTILTDEGLLQAEVGRGTFVAAPHAHKPYIPVEIHATADNNPQEVHRVPLFSPALPDLGQSDLIKELLSQVAANPASGLMHYPTRRTGAPARAAALAWLPGDVLGHMDDEDVVLTLGGQNAIILVLQTVLRGRRPTVLVEELAYPGFRRAAELLRADVVAVEMDENGLIPEALDRAARGCDAQILCTSPEVHNPTTLNTPVSRRRELVDVARQHGLQILEDDCYRMGSNREASYRALAPDLGWYISSIAKTLTPALRLGFAIAPAGRGGALRRAKEHGLFGLPTPMLDLAALLLDDPRTDTLTAQARDVYAQYIDVAAQCLKGYDLKYRRDVPFLWLNLPQGWRANAFCQAAEAAEVPVRSAEEFADRDARAPHAVRLAVNAGVGLASFEAAIRRLRNLLDNPLAQISV